MRVHDPSRVSRVRWCTLWKMSYRAACTRCVCCRGAVAVRRRESRPKNHVGGSGGSQTYWELDRRHGRLGYRKDRRDVAFDCRLDGQRQAGREDLAPDGRVVDLAAPIVRRRAGPKCDFARRERAEKAQTLSRGSFRLKTSLSASSTARAWHQRLAISNPMRSI